MLPFAKRQEGSVSMPSEKLHYESPEAIEPDVMEYVASDILSAIESKDTKALAEALKACFDLYESQPHQEAGE